MLLGLLAIGCGGERLTDGATEPLRIEGAQFFPGELPGSRPLNLEEVRAGKQPQKPFSTTPEIAGRVLSSGEASLGISGTASQDSYAVALKLDKLGSGYWVLPVGSPDPFNNNDLAWSARVDLGDIPPGLQQLRVAALNEENRAGTQRSLELCIRSPIPDNLNACEPTIEPPRLVANLEWESSADLDLAVLTPSGEVINYAHVNDTKETDAPGEFSGDGGSGCIPSGMRRESIVWQAKPGKGIYYIYVNLHDACQDSATPFQVSTHVSKRDGEEYKLVETYRTASEALRVQANGGTALGSFITEFVVD
jgi:hypothetical protein